MPELQKFYAKYHAKGLEIVGISVDKAPDGIKDFITKLKVTFPVVHDEGHKAADKYAPPRMPSSYIIDKKGVVRYVHVVTAQATRLRSRKRFKSCSRSSRARSIAAGPRCFRNSAGRIVSPVARQRRARVRA